MPAAPHTTHPIHLAPLHPAEAAAAAAGSSLSTKGSHEVLGEDQPRPRKQWTRPTWQQVELILCASVPLALHLIGLVLVLVALVQTGTPYMKVRQVGGNGLMDYGILGSCARSPGTTERICTSSSLYVNFMPSIILISDQIPGFAALKLPLKSIQTPSILLSAVVMLGTALLVYLPLWTLAYFPSAPLPAPIVKFIRFYARRLFQVVGVLSFIAMIFTFTIGLGYKLLLIASVEDFNAWIAYAGWQGLIKDWTTQWVAEIGSAFDLLWASTVCQALVALSVKVALHNGLDEQIEWPSESKSSSNYWA